MSQYNQIYIYSSHTQYKDYDLKASLWLELKFHEIIIDDPITTEENNHKIHENSQKNKPNETKITSF